MKVIQNFSSGKHIKKLPIVDILIWYKGVQSLKTLGYTTKLYCTEADIEFLNKGGLVAFYDEIDTTFLTTFKASIDETNFGSVRKLECIKHEFEVSSDAFIYMDTDIILLNYFDFNTDLAIGSPEKKSYVYPNGADLSLPVGYSLPEGLYTAETAFNCGILGFKDGATFNSYLTEFYKFTTNNPCKITNYNLRTDSEKRCVGACNAEQRILKGWSDHLNLTITSFMSETGLGISDKGVHFYILRHNGRLLRPQKQLQNENAVLVENCLKTLNSYVVELLSQLDETGLSLFTNNSKDLYNLYYNNKPLTDYI